ncbi:MAG: ATP-dependent DNA helicase [Candidatus Paralactobacillus gallistercoris]|uniref:ATP-dependent DNA helicase RecQ n=1 Tax=Candidatus Paralactobacillus gallistercoris TaxID=2838724 RepID=A0A948X345_9LACO|nr:ATP-dependent DNA helicase [Candidatus Paralactobacillus gallistercoris]
MITTRQIKQFLQRRFHFDKFKPGQLPIIQAVLQHRDALGVLPTGTGKSLCYQLPGMLMNGLTLIVSPLLSLMNDQVQQLQMLHEKRVVALNSLLSFAEKQTVLRHLEHYRFIFLAPETLTQADVLQRLKKCHIGLFVIDEAHCISQWGPDFRPDYLTLGTIKKQLHPDATLALTATATPVVQKDILQQLQLQHPLCQVTTVDRPNIYLATVHVPNEVTKQQQILKTVEHCQGPGIIYFSSRQKTEEMADWLQQNAHLRTAYYHGELNSNERFLVQEQFRNGEIDVICATSAFGMGINQPNIRFVIHYHMPNDLESYWQEIGRAGRDGKQSIAVLFYSDSDLQLQRLLINNDLPNKAVIELFYKNPQWFSKVNTPEFELLTRYYQQHIPMQQVIKLLQTRSYEKQDSLQKMITFVTTDSCKRAFLLNYFGAQQHIVHTDECCDFTPDPHILQKLGLYITKPKITTVELTPWSTILKQLF